MAILDPNSESGNYEQDLLEMISHDLAIKSSLLIDILGSSSSIGVMCACEIPIRIYPIYNAQVAQVIEMCVKHKMPIP